MKKKKVYSLFLVVCMIVQLLSSMQVSAAEKSQTKDVSRWKYQNNKSDVVKEVPEGGITETENGILVDYTKFNNESVVLYNEESPQYGNSQLEFDVTVEAEQDGFYRFLPIGRFVDGNNYVGLGYDTQYYYNSFKNGVVTNKNFSGVEMEVGQTYSMKLISKGSVFTLYRDGEEMVTVDGEDSCVTEAGKYGFRIWGGDQATAAGKKVLIENIQFVELEGVSDIQKTFVNVKEDKWGAEDVIIPIELKENSPLLSIKMGETVLEEGQDYHVDNTDIVIHKEYISKQSDSFRLLISFEGNENCPFQVNKVKDVTGEYVEDFSDGNIDNWKKESGSGSIALEKDGLRIKGQTNLVNTESPELENAEIEVWMEALNDNGGLGIVFRNNDESWQSIYNRDSAVQNYAFSRWNFRTSKNKNSEITLDSPFFKQAHHLKVRYIDNAVTLWINEQLVYSGTLAEAETVFGKMGFTTESSSDVLIKKIKYRSVEPLEVSEDPSEQEIVLSKDNMIVKLDDNFPRVLNYTLNGKTMNGSPLPYYYVTINTNDYKATASVEKQSETSVSYHVDVAEVGVSFDVVFTMEDNHVLDMRIKNIVEKQDKVRSIAIPNQMLISADNSQSDAKLDASSGGSDKHLSLANESAAKDRITFASIPTLSVNGLSAAMTNNAIRNLTEFAYQSFDLGDGKVATGYWTSEYLYRGWDNSRVWENEDLYTKVILTEDTNSDEIIDWQDAGNALKYLNEGKIKGSEKVANSMIHIGYNFAGVVQNPYLKIADNIKRLSNYIDGFDQIFVLKGYANEGHDSGHADYADINERAGGAADMNLAIEEMEKYNSIMGIHINHSEAYPEAKMYTDEVMSTKLGWKWLDQSTYIRREIDIMNGGMDSRLNEMFEKVPGIGFVYVDTYRDEKWAASRIARNLSDQHNVIMATEEGYKLDRWTAWSHGSEPGTMHRFVYHNQKDIYGSDKVLRSGYSKSTDNGFMGWQHGNNINNTVRQFYTEQLPQKYLMNYKLLKWTPNTEAIFEDGVVSKVENGKSNIYKNERLIASDKLVFIPWYAEDSETRDPDDADKIYHWNPNGGESTWTLPEEWNEQTSVKLYETKQNGKELIREIPVVDHQVVIDAKVNTPYVIYKGEEEVTIRETEWSVGSPIKDTSFNTHDFSIWKRDSKENELADNVKFIYDADGISTLQIDTAADGSVSQEMTGLQSGQKYRVSVWASALNGKRANLTVKLKDGTEVTRYTDLTKNSSFVHDHYVKGKKFQIMWVDFVLPEGETTAEIILSADESGEDGVVQFMETRIVKTDDPGMPQGYVAYEDFEHVDQAGHGIFEPEGFAGTTHLSQAHEPYTTDTITGEWSYKFNSAVRTTPTTLRMQPNTTYTMEFNTKNSGTVEVLSESTRNKLLSERTKEGAHTYTFTTDDKADYIVRFTSGQILDDFRVYEGEPIDKTSLNQLLQEMGKIENDSYTPSSWKEFQNAMEKAQAASEEMRISKADIDKAEKDLENAYAGLKKQAIRDIMEIVLEEAETIAKEELDGVIESARKQFIQAWENAKVVNANLDATQEEVDAAAVALLDAMNNLIPAGDKTHLKELIDLAESLDLVEYTPQSIVGFDVVLNDAKNVMEDGNAIEEMVKEAESALQKAIDKLVYKADKSRLAYTIELAKKYDLSIYVEEGQDIFVTALENANNAMKDENISQDKVDQIKEELIRAMTSLRKKANKENLESIVKRVKELDLSLYTKESVAKVKVLLAEAEQILKDEMLDETQQYKVDDAAVKLQAAVEHLQLADKGDFGDADIPGTGQDDEDTSNTGTSNSSKEDSIENQKIPSAAKTGDTHSLAVWMLIAIASGISVLKLKKKNY